MLQLNFKLIVLSMVVAVTSANHYAWYSECGVSKNYPKNNEEAQFIVNGEDSPLNAFPWIVSLQSVLTGRHSCGGSIISPTTVLTAGHCARNSTASEWQVVIGDHSFTDDDPAQTIYIEKFIIHEDFVDDFDPANDIALLILAENITLSDKVYPVCAPEPNNSYAGTTAQVAGWGRLDYVEPGVPEWLQYITVPVITNDVCNQQKLRDIVTDDMICAGGVMYDACQGDSGGPMTVEANDGIVDLIGAVSWGDGCASGKPGVYARISKFVDWVAEHMT